MDITSYFLSLPHPEHVRRCFSNRSKTNAFDFIDVIIVLAKYNYYISKITK